MAANYNTNRILILYIVQQKHSFHSQITHSKDIKTRILNPNLQDSTEKTQFISHGISTCLELMEKFRTYTRSPTITDDQHSTYCDFAAKYSKLWS